MKSNSTTHFNILNKSVLLLLFFTSAVSVYSQDTYLDNFDVNPNPATTNVNPYQYNNTNGTENWNGNPWIEIEPFGDNNNPAADFIQVTDVDTDADNELRFNWIWTETIQRTANLSGYTTAILSFDVVSNSVDIGEELLIVVSGNGNTSLPFSIGFNDTSPFSEDISAYIDTNTTITLSGGNEDWESANTIAIDNFQITLTSAPPALDTDGDMIPDNVDLDDDNDGITDEEEYCTDLNASLFASGDVGLRSETFNHVDTGYFSLDFTALDNSFQLLINGGGIHNSVLEFEDGALGTGEIYTVFESDDAFITTPWRPNVNGLPRIRLIIDESGEITLFGSRTTTATILEPMHTLGGVPFNTINWIPGNNNTFTIINQDGPGPESMNASLFASAICDFDGDGTNNNLDLDSDNDGIYDIVESGVLDVAGVNDANNDGIIDGSPIDFGANGLYNTIEDNDIQAANLTYTINDTDTDGEYDAYDLDSDGDLCLDVTEAGFTDPDADGYLGNSPVSVNGDAVVIGQGGYTTPLDTSPSNGIFDFQEAAIPFWVTATGALDQTYECAADVPSQTPPVASDGCGAITVTEISDVTTPGSCVNSYVRVLSYEAENGSGNTSPLFTTTITVEDTTAPTASNLSPITVLCTAEITTPDILLITDEADNCTANPVVTFVNDVSNGGTNPEIITRTYRVTDECSNSTDVTQIITVAPIAITTQPANITANAGDNPTFSVVVSNVDTYQWQVSTNGGTSFSDVSDGVEHSGSQTATLTVNSIDIDKNNYQYRVIVSNATTSCASVTSNAAIVTTRVRTVITNRKITYRVKKN